MKRNAWLGTIRMGLIACLLPACAHTSGTTTGPSASDPRPATEVAEQHYPGWPPPPAAPAGEETQSVPPVLPLPETKQPLPDNSQLTAVSDLKIGQPIQRTEGTVEPDGPSLPPSTSTPEPLPGSVRNAPPPLPVAEKTPLPSDEPVVLALRSLLNDKPEEALEHLKHYDAANQEALICLTATVARLTKKKLDQLSPTEVAGLQDQLQKSLLGALRPRAELLIDKMCFCEWIKGYGNYGPLPENYEFQPKVGDRPGESVQVYVELRNLTSEVRGTAYETRLQSTMRIFDQGGKEVVFRAFPDRDGPFRTLTPLPDYFKSYSFYVPHMPPGKYTLTFEVKDVTRPETPRSACKSLEFRVAAP
jgi:hypothetical protein